MVLQRSSALLSSQRVEENTKKSSVMDYGSVLYLTNLES